MKLNVTEESTKLFLWRNKQSKSTSKFILLKSESMTNGRDPGCGSLQEHCNPWKSICKDSNLFFSNLKYLLRYEDKIHFLPL